MKKGREQEMEGGELRTLGRKDRMLVKGTEKSAIRGENGKLSADLSSQYVLIVRKCADLAIVTLTVMSPCMYVSMRLAELPRQPSWAG